MNSPSVPFGPKVAFHYPDFPDEIRFVNSGLTLPILRGAANVQEIVGWAESNKVTSGASMITLHSTRPVADYFAVYYIWTNGRQAWNVHLYALHPDKINDSKPWKLLYVGSEGLTTQHSNDIECVYIDNAKRALVFATRGGRTIGAIKIDRELRLLERPFGKRMADTDSLRVIAVQPRLESGRAVLRSVGRTSAGDSSCKKASPTHR